MSTTTAVSTPADLHLMPYGRGEARNVRDGLYEPLWGGRRVLVDVLGGRVGLRDEDNEELEGYDALRESILELTRADEIVLDGHLLPAPLRETAGAGSPLEADAVMSARGLGSQLILGGALSGRKQRDTTSLPPAPVPSDSPTAFVAVDLLWLDGESLIDVPLLERKRLLDSVLLDGEIVRRTVAVRAPVDEWYGQWRMLGFRELIVKGANSRYTPGRPNDEWGTAFIPKR
jgi:hypothetical protein